ncbi:MAG TPA: hypothetical protein VH008_24070 [Pseudonocardia sp.]|nr:hypothetical protein [Pseudonocardia sp.]
MPGRPDLPGSAGGAGLPERRDPVPSAVDPLNGPISSSGEFGYHPPLANPFGGPDSSTFDSSALWAPSTDTGGNSGWLPATPLPAGAPLFGAGPGTEQDEQSVREWMAEPERLEMPVASLGGDLFGLGPDVLPIGNPFDGPPASRDDTRSDSEGAGANGFHDSGSGSGSRDRDAGSSDGGSFGPDAHESALSFEGGAFGDRAFEGGAFEDGAFEGSSEGGGYADDSGYGNDESGRVEAGTERRDAGDSGDLAGADYRVAGSDAHGDAHYADGDAGGDSEYDDYDSEYDDAAAPEPEHARRSDVHADAGGSADAGDDAGDDADATDDDDSGDDDGFGWPEFDEPDAAADGAANGDAPPTGGSPDDGGPGKGQRDTRRQPREAAAGH